MSIYFFSLFSKVWNPPAYDIDPPEQDVLINDDKTPLTVKVKLATEYVGSKFRVRYHQKTVFDSFKLELTSKKIIYKIPSKTG